MSLRFTRWTVPLLLAVGVWGGFTQVSAEPGSAMEPASQEPVAEDGATEDTAALGGDPIEGSQLLPLSGFS